MIAHKQLALLGSWVVSLRENNGLLSQFNNSCPPEDDPLTFHLACPHGSYKMSSRQQECFPCPANSKAEEEGSVECVCEEDHFRTPLDTPSAACTRPPSPPRDLVYTLKQSTLILEWAAPSDTGGRVDLTYSVGCRRCVGRQCEPCGTSVGFVPQQVGLTERTVTLVNLLPNTNYTFTVEALNGVSELLPNKRFYTQVNVSTSLP
ncbi:hypothetical protein JOQ06_015495, partial [Pogonophryne albipinna]